MLVTLLDDVDNVRRLATVLAQQDGRVLVRVTRDVGMTYVYWQDATRVIDHQQREPRAGR